MEKIIDVTAKCTASGATEEMTTLQFVVIDEKNIATVQVSLQSIDLELSKKFSPKKNYLITITEQ